MSAAAVPASTTPVNPQLVSESAFFLPSDTETPRFRFLVDDPKTGQRRDPIHDRMKNHPFYGKRITLRSINGKGGQPVGVSISKRKGTENGWMGIPRLSPEQQQIMESHGFSLAVPGETYVKVPDGEEIDLGTEEGLYQWEWMQFASQIITDTDNYDPEKPHEGADKELYVLIPSEEQRKTAQNFYDRKIVGDWLFSMNPREWYDIARLIGSGMDNSKQMDVFNYLQDVAQKTPDRLKSIMNDNQRSFKLLVKRLLDRNIIQETNGVFLYNSVALGTTEEQVLFYIMDASHEAVVQHMRNQLGVDGGLGGQPVPTQYASYADTPNESVVRQQASAPSSTLGLHQSLSQHRTQVAAPAPAANQVADAPITVPAEGLSNDDLGDDYVEEETGESDDTDTPTAPLTRPGRRTRNQ